MGNLRLQGIVPGPVRRSRGGRGSVTRGRGEHYESHRGRCLILLSRQPAATRSFYAKELRSDLESATLF